MSGQGRPSDAIRERIEGILEIEGAEISIFHLLDRDEIRQIAAYMDLARWPAGSTIVAEGEKVDFLGIIAEGKVEARHRPAIEGKHLTIAHLEEGAHFGGIAAEGGRPAMATLFAEEETVLLVLTCARFEKFAADHPATAVKLLKGVVEVLTIRLESAIERVVRFF